jgi:hypothetical protein
MPQDNQTPSMQQFRSVPSTGAAQAPNGMQGQGTSDLTQNPMGEGLYYLTDSKGNINMSGIPYSQVPNALKQGYNFPFNEEQARYQKDFNYAQNHPTEATQKQQQVTAPRAPDTVSARPNNVANWLEDAGNDLRYGDQNTAVGKIYRGIGGPKNGLYGGVAPSTAELMGGDVLGPFTAAHGVNDIAHGHPIRGANETLRGVGQTLAIPMAATNPEFLPSLAGYGAVGSGVTKAASAAGLDPDWSQFAGNAAMFAVPGLNTAVPKIGKAIENNAAPIARTAGVMSGLGAAARAAHKGDWGMVLPELGGGYWAATKGAPMIRGVGKAIQNFNIPNPLPSLAGESPYTASEEFTNPPKTSRVEIFNSIMKPNGGNAAQSIVDAMNALHEYNYGNKPTPSGRDEFSGRPVPVMSNTPKGFKMNPYGPSGFGYALSPKYPEQSLAGIIAKHNADNPASSTPLLSRSDDFMDMVDKHMGRPTVAAPDTATSKPVPVPPPVGQPTGKPFMSTVDQAVDNATRRANSTNEWNNWAAQSGTRTPDWMKERIQQNVPSLRDAGAAPAKSTPSQTPKLAPKDFGKDIKEPAFGDAFGLGTLTKGGSKIIPGRGAFHDADDNWYRSLEHRIGTENRSLLEGSPLTGVQMARALTKAKGSDLVDWANQNGGKDENGKPFDASKMGRNVAEHGKNVSPYKASVMKWIIIHVPHEDTIDHWGTK